MIIPVLFSNVIVLTNIIYGVTEMHLKIISLNSSTEFQLSLNNYFKTNQRTK